METSKRTSLSKEWERQRRNKFNAAISKLGEVVKNINKENNPDLNDGNASIPKVEIVQNAILCLSNCMQEKTQLKAEVLALQVKLENKSNKIDAVTQVNIGKYKKNKDITKDNSGVIQKKSIKLLAKKKPSLLLPKKIVPLRPKINIYDKTGTENTIVVLPAAPYILPQRPLFLPSMPPALILVDSNIQGLNKKQVVGNRNCNDITKTTMVNILPISAYSRPLSAAKLKRNPKGNKIKIENNKNKQVSKLKPPDKSVANAENKKIEDTSVKTKLIEKVVKDINTNDDVDKCLLKVIDKESKNINDKKINSESKEINISPQNISSNNGSKIAENTKTIKELEPNKIDSLPKIINSNSIINPAFTGSSELGKPYEKPAITDKGKENKLNNLLDGSLCENTVDGGSARLELAEEFLAASPTAAFLMSFPLVSGNRADSPLEDSHVQTPTKSVTERRHESLLQVPYFEKPSSNIQKIKPDIQPITTSGVNKFTDCQNVVTKTTEIKVATLPTSANMISDNPFLNLTLPTLVSTSSSLPDTNFGIDFENTVNKSLPNQTSSYATSSNLFYKSDPFSTVKNSIYSTSNISSGHELNNIGLYPCAMDKYSTSKSKSDLSNIEDNLMKMGSSRLTYDIDLGWSHKGFDFVNSSTTANTFNKDSILTSTSTNYTPNYTPFNPEFHVPLVNSSNKKEITNKPMTSFVDTITNFYSQSGNLWSDDVPFYTNTNIAKTFSKQQNYVSLDQNQPSIILKPNDKVFETKLNQAAGDVRSKVSNPVANQALDKFTKKSPNKMHINWMTSEIRPSQNNYYIPPEIKDSHKTHYVSNDLSTKKTDQNDGNYFPLSLHNFPTQAAQEEFQVWPSARPLGTAEVSIDPPPINLPTLVGDLALGPHDKKKQSDTTTRAIAQTENLCNNFLSVTQLMNRSNDEMTRYQPTNVESNKTGVFKHTNAQFTNDARKTTRPENIQNQSCYTYNNSKTNTYESINHFNQNKSKVNKSDKISKVHKNNYSAEALIRGGNQKMHDSSNGKFPMHTQKYIDYNASQDSGIAHITHFPSIIDYTDNSFTGQQFSGSTLYNSTTNNMSNTFYTNFIPTSNLMTSNYTGTPFTSEYVDYNQTTECNYGNQKYEEFKMVNKTGYSHEKNSNSKRRESSGKHKLECKKDKKFPSKRTKVGNEMEDWNDTSQLWQNKHLNKRHPNIPVTEDITFPNYVGNQMPSQYQTEFFNSHLMTPNVQSISQNVDRSTASFPASSRANFNLSTIFPEITMKVQ